MLLVLARAKRQVQSCLKVRSYKNSTGREQRARHSVEKQNEACVYCLEISLAFWPSLAGQTLSASGRGSGDIPILELCRHAGIFQA